MGLYRSAVIAGSLLMLAACAAPVLDADNEQAWARSVQAVRGDLAESQRSEFNDALSAFEPAPASGTTVGTRPPGSTPIIELDGLDAAQVIARAKERRSGQEAQQREQALAEIAALEARLAGVLEGQAGRVEGVQIRETRFSKEPSAKPDTLEPFLWLTLQNDSNLTIAKVTAVGTLSSPGRDQPWLEQEFDFDLFGGVPPGGRRETILRPGAYSKWGQVQVADDAQLQLRIVAVHTAEGRRYLPPSAFTEADARRLRELKARY